MSMTESEARFEEWIEELYAEHKEQAIEEFRSERLQSFYANNPAIATSPSQALAEAESLLLEHPRAGFLLAAIASEVTLKKVILHPVVYGLVNSKSTADLITSLAMGYAQLERLKKLLSLILQQYAGMDLERFKRTGAKKTLWEESESIRKKRNAVVHEAENVTQIEAQLSLEVATFLTKELVPQLLKRLGMVVDPTDGLVKHRAEWETERI